MNDDTKIDPEWAWAAYSPSAKAPWDVRRVGHLFRRAAFGPTPADLDAGLKDGPAKALARLLAGGPKLDEFERSMKPLADTIAKTNADANLAAWWLTRMLYSPHPLAEKMTLFWHNHFATSNAKVQNARYMLAQYDLLRKNALGSFATMLTGMSADQAMLVWLDGRGSKKGSPNENYARELMELFSLGLGDYTEKDVREAARAFTGWEVGSAAKFTPGDHDAGDKTVLGKSGKWKPDDVVRICLDRPACPLFLCEKLFRFLVSDTLPATKALLAPLADAYKKSDYDTGALVKTILSSNLFFSEDAYRTKVKSPVEFALGAVKAIGGRIGTSALALTLTQLGQNLFHPPSVKGWDGGPAWLNGQTLLFRQNLALALCSTEDPRFGTRLDPAALARKLGAKTDADLVEGFLRVFLQGDVPAESRKRLLTYAERSHGQPVPVYWTAEDAAAQRVRTLCHLVMTLPEYQLD
jgi:uncharacterized protein (DUF1800 family)